MYQDNLNVQWEDFSDHLRSMLHDMLRTTEFTDVTLICDDQREFQAHKVILSACSPVFRNMFYGRNTPNSIIYLKGIKYQSLDALLQFMYKGEAVFPQNNLETFLEVAKSLQVKELGDDVGLGGGLMDTQNSTEEVQQQNHQEATTKLAENVAVKVEEKVKPVFLKQKGNNVVASNQKKESSLLKQNIQSLKSKNNSSASQSSKFFCDLCDKVFDTKSQVAKHAREAHGKSQVYACKKDFCGYVTSEKTNLRSHIESHKMENENQDVDDPAPQETDEAEKDNDNVKETKKDEEAETKIYACFMCMYKTKDKYELKNHALTAHKDSFPAPIPPSLVKNNE